MSGTGGHLSRHPYVYPSARPLLRGHLWRDTRDGFPLFRRSRTATPAALQDGSPSHPSSSVRSNPLVPFPAALFTSTRHCPFSSPTPAPHPLLSVPPAGRISRGEFFSPARSSARNPLLITISAAQGTGFPLPRQRSSYSSSSSSSSKTPSSAPPRRPLSRSRMPRSGYDISGFAGSFAPRLDSRVRAAMERSGKGTCDGEGGNGGTGAKDRQAQQQQKVDVRFLFPPGRTDLLINVFRTSPVSIHPLFCFFPMPNPRSESEAVGRARCSLPHQRSRVLSQPPLGEYRFPLCCLLSPLPPDYALTNGLKMVLVTKSVDDRKTKRG